MGTTLLVQTCEACSSEHSGTFGSGRFCDAACARSFSTKHARREISAKVSRKLKGRPAAHDKGFKPGKDERRRELSHEDRKRAVQVSSEIRREFYATAAWSDLPLTERYRRIMAEQNGKCLWCSVSTWRDMALTLEIDHINGRHQDNRRENLRYLCPNCHSQTPTFRNKKRDAL